VEELVGLGVAADHRLGEHERPVDVDVKDLVPAGDAMAGGMPPGKNAGSSSNGAD
jgi:hypothetical protein